MVLLGVRTGPRHSQHSSKDGCAQEWGGTGGDKRGRQKEREKLSTHLGLLSWSLSWKETGRGIRG